MKNLLRRLSVAVAAGLASTAATAQTPRPLDHAVYDTWRSIRARVLSPDGRWIAYTETPGQGDGALQVVGLRSDARHVVARGTEAEFSADSRYLIFAISPEDSIVKAQRRDGVRGDRLPKDSLGILDLGSGGIVRVAEVRSFALAEDDSDWVAYHLEKTPSTGRDSSDAGTGERGRRADDDERSKEDGTTLVVRALATGLERRYELVREYVVADPGNRLAFARSSRAGDRDGVFIVELDGEGEMVVTAGQGDYQSLAFSADGDQLAYLSNAADYDAEQPEFAVEVWRAGETTRIVARSDTPGVPPNWWVSEHGDVEFTPTGERLLLGTAPRPAPTPDDVPEWERVEVDIWNWRDPLLQPMQLVQRQRELQRSYRAVVHLTEDRFVQLARPDMPTVAIGQDGDGDVAIASTNMPYRREISWESPRFNDAYLVDVQTGDRRRVLEAVRSTPQLSPGGNYLTWWDGDARAWLAMAVAGGDPVNLTEGIPYPVYNELHDRPMLPGAWGNAGWTDDDRDFLVYDRHDLWATDPMGRAAPRNITEGTGRREGLRFRYVSLDPDRTAIDANDPIILSTFDFATKAGGFSRDRVAGNRPPERLVTAPQRFGRPTKASDADVVAFTRESFRDFPNLWISDTDFDEMRQVSDANPQQSDYRWGSAELVSWTSTDGLPLRGLLFKPDGFDPIRQYPMMVYFYEKMSDQLHAHRAPSPGGSSINISYYVSQGYVVFVPDIYYRDGYPGESALNCVVPGVLSVVAQGFVDPARIGVQGHSWGGYQIAYLVTRTNIFAAAEAGAPVVNMTSAYGGIRWGTGMSRMFQYERTQSRLGGSLWEARARYIENSPLFWADKIETPVLMLHNDEDTAVPWYQGIEFFVALRRLDKPVFMLNYNGEPHGLRKWQNRKDWAIRMQQFFDHYLRDAPPPVWMVEGVPAVVKGVDDGLELVTPQTTGTTGNGR